MSQLIFDNIDPAIVGGTELAQILNDFKDAIMTSLSGTSRPAELQPGGFWIDVTDSTNWIYKMYNGTTDITVFTVNVVNNTIALQGSSDLFEISRFTEDAVGPVLSLFKGRIASSGQTKSQDNVGSLVFKAKGTGGTPYTIGRIRYVANEDITASAQGGYFVIEGTITGASTMTEFARVIDGKFGIGTTAPTHALHVVSTTGIKNERSSDDATGARTVQKKKRIAGSGQVLNADEISRQDYNSMDNTGTEFTAFRISTTADENHTASARGTKVSLQAIAKGTTTLAEVVAFYEGIQELTGVQLRDALQKKVQTYASVADVSNFDAQKSFIEVTGTTAMTIRGILSTSKSKSFVLFNATTQNITVVNQDASVTAIDRIAVNGESSLTIQPGKSVEFMRRDSISRWSPLVEGNTGITYNEAVAISAQIVARSWTQEFVQKKYATFLTETEVPVIETVRTVGGISPIIIALGARGDNNPVLAYSGFPYGTWFLQPLSSANHQGTGWKLASQGTTVAPPALPAPGNEGRVLAVRPTGTNRSLYWAVGIGPGLVDGGIDNSVTWREASQGHSSSFYAVSSAGAYRVGVKAYSGGAWTYVASTTMDVPLYSIAYGGGLVVAVGGVVPGGSPNHSSWVHNGTSWSSYAMPNESTVAYSLVRFCGSQFVAVGDVAANGQKILTSPDGQTWTTRATLAVGLTVTDISYGNGLAIATTDSDKFVISTDLVNWTTITSLFGLGQIAYTGQNFVATALGVSKTSSIFKSISPSF